MRSSIIGIKKICIITPGTIASNPRVVKEAAALSEAGYLVHLIYTRHVQSLVDQDEEILRLHPEWTFNHLDWAGQNFKPRSFKLFSGLKKRLAGLVLKFELYPPVFAGFLLNRFYFWQLYWAIKIKADLYIAHYPDSIAVAAKAAKINNAIFTYDAEDYHRGEDLPVYITKIIKVNEDRYLSKAGYISGSSLLISKAYQKLFPETFIFTIENTFPPDRQVSFKNLNLNPVKFFWFSQTIGPGRGLEQFIHILSFLKGANMRLTLLGNVLKDYRSGLKALWINAGLKPVNLIFINTVPEKEVFEIASEQHIGLCLEVPKVPNKDFCLSNKLYTYILAGNVLILSKTKSQNNFYIKYPQTGLSIDLDKSQEASEKIRALISNQSELNLIRTHNHELGKNKLNYNSDKKILLKHIGKLLQ